MNKIVFFNPNKITTEHAVQQMIKELMLSRRMVSKLAGVMV